MRIFDKFIYALFIFLLIPGKNGLCQQGNGCKQIVNRKDKITAVLQQDFSDGMISGHLHIELIRELNKPISLTFYIEDYEYPVSEKDSLGMLAYISPYELREGMDVLFQFSDKDSLLFDGKQTLKNLEPIYKNQAEEQSAFTCRYPPPLYPAKKSITFFLVYKIPLNEKDVDLLLKKRLQNIVIKNGNIGFLVSDNNATQLKSLANCLVTNKPGQ